jgi:hypothetical protein
MSSLITTSDGDVSAAQPLAVSVVIPTRGNFQALDRCLAALINQDFPASGYEVIVVDDAARDLTRHQVQRWARVSPVRCYYLPNGPGRGPAAARNLGWRLARGTIVAFTDDDCCPEPNWLKVGVAGFVADTAAVWGDVSAPIPAAEVPSAFATANLFCRRDVLAVVGGCDERFTLAWRADPDLYLTLLEAHLPVRHVAEARVVRPPGAPPWSAGLRQQRESMFNALLYKKHPFYRHRCPDGPAWGYYATVMALVGAIGAATAGLFTAAEISMLLWLVLTLELADRRLRHTALHPWQVCRIVFAAAVLPLLAVFWRLRGALRFRVWYF